jgi:hypothetical protein
MVTAQLGRFAPREGGRLPTAVWTIGSEIGIYSGVVTGLDPVTHVLLSFLETKSWMAGSSPAMTGLDALRSRSL